MRQLGKLQQRCGVLLQVKYKNVMKHYNLGPNGGILTSCNLFATRFDQVGARMGILAGRLC